MGVLSVALLAVGVVGLLARPRGLPGWVAPLLAALVAVLVGVTSLEDARAALDPLVAPILFLLVAVPLAVLLDDLGVFEAAATVASRRRQLVGGLWVLGAVTVAVLNLDAAVVLLTPLYVRVARRTGLDPVALAFQPVLLACLASSFLPVSNLTNLIAAHQADLGTRDFLAHLGLPSLVAVGVGVGWWMYRRAFSLPAHAGTPGGVVDRTALRTGAIALAYLVIGSSLGPSFGVQPWVVALVADVVLAWRARTVPWRSIPWATAVIAGALAILATAAADELPIRSWVSGTGPAALARTIGISAAGANLVNNLPAFLVGSSRIGHHESPRLWALLLGVNVGPTLLVTGTLAGLLWLDSVRRLDLDVGPAAFFRAGLRVGMPALLASGAALVLLEQLR